MKKRIDLNCDLGESYGRSVSGTDQKIMPFISSCNIACGFHSGDPHSILNSIDAALEHKVAIGAHPSFPDLQGFGRRLMKLPADELYACLLYQISALKSMTESRGGKLHHVKPHGALYNFASKDTETANVISKAVLHSDSNLLLYAPGHSVLAKTAAKNGVKVVSEAFCDRRYEKDLSLRSRALEDAVLYEPEAVLEQLKMMIQEGKVQTLAGEKISIEAQTICLHSDTQNSIHLAEVIHEYLCSHEIKITAV